MLVTPAAAHPSRRAQAWLTCNVRNLPLVRHRPHELEVAGRKNEDEGDAAFPCVKNYRWFRRRR